MAGEMKYVETIGSLMPQPAGMVFSVTLKAYSFMIDWGRADPVQQALERLQREIDELKTAVDALRQRLNATELRLARIENKLNVDTFVELSREAGRIAFRLSQGLSDPNDREELAFDAQALADRFLNEFSIWQWTDIQVSRRFDGDGNSVGADVHALAPDFKAQLALPIYAYSVLLLIAAIDLDSGGDPPAVASRYGAALDRHVAACTSRDGWSELAAPPVTLAENIRSRITCFPQAQNKFAAEGECRVSIVCENAMERTRISVAETSIWLPDRGNSVICTFDPDIGLSHEQDVEEEKGIGLLSALADMMRRVRKNGSLRDPFIGQFLMAPPVPFAFLYGIGLDGSLDWYRQTPGAGAGVATEWQARKGIRTDWGAYLKIFPAGGNRFYALHPSGELHWWQHDGFNDGAPQWKGPKIVGTGWGDLREIVPGGDGVLYAIQTDGIMLRFRHDGLSEGGGPGTWRKATLTGGWDKFLRVFSVNDGVLYAVAGDGKLIWWHDPGFKLGTALPMEGPRQVGTGWADLRDAFGTDNGVVYGQKPDGTLLRFVHTGWKTGGDVTTWTGPNSVAFGVGGYRQMIALMSAGTTLH